MTNNRTITFTLDGKQTKACADETIWQVAKRLGHTIPHLCHKPQGHYRADGNCRLCMVEIKGGRTLSASCITHPTPGMEVVTNSPRVMHSQQHIIKLLLADQNQNQEPTDNALTYWARSCQVDTSEYPKSVHAEPRADESHPAMSVNLSACIHCGLCVRACREIQVNDVIGMAKRGALQSIVFDLDDLMGDSTCVGCGECVQACPTDALLTKSPSKNPIDTKKITSVCPYCGVGCQLNYHVKNNKIITVDGHPGPANDGRLCVKGRFGFDYINHSGRLTTPLIRKDGVAKTEEITIDPNNPYSHFRAASWQEALMVATKGLTAIKEQYAHRSGYGLAGFGSAKCTNEEAYLFQKLVRTGFGNHNVDHCTRLCHASSVAALLETIGSGAVTAPFNEALNSEVIIIIGANPSENHPVASSFIKNAVKNGSQLIIMDPRGQALKDYATHSLCFRPGRDVALLNAIMWVIVEEKLYNSSYIEQHTQGFEPFIQSLKQFDLNHLSIICGISSETIKTVARTYATASSALIFWGMGVSQHTHGTDNARCLISLALMCGHIGKKGSGLHPLRGQNNVQGASDAGLIPMMLPDYQLVSDTQIRSKFSTFWQTPLSDEPGLTVVEIMDAIHQGRIKGMYIMGENPAMSDPDLSHARQALAKLEHLVVQDIFLTETASFADVILPASAWPEKEGTVTNTNRQVQKGRIAVPLPGQAQPDWWIIQEIANGIGLNWTYNNPEDVFEEMRLIMPSLKHISWQRLDQEGAVTYPCHSPDQPGQSIVFHDGFPTQSGRAKFVFATLKDPDELPDPDYPYILTTGRKLEHWHTGAMTRRAQILNSLEPQAHACLCQEDMDHLNIQPGDMIRIKTRRGEITLNARLDGAIHQGSIFVPFCYVEAPANILTNPKLDPFGKIPEFKYCAAKIEPINELY